MASHVSMDPWLGGSCWRFNSSSIFILFGTVPWLPEDSRRLIAHDQIEEAEQMIADVEATSVEDPYVVTELKEIQWAVQYERDNGVSWADLLRGRS